MSALTEREICSLVDGTYTKETLAKLDEITNQDMEEYRYSGAFCLFQRKVVGVKIGSSNALECIRDWAANVPGANKAKSVSSAPIFEGDNLISFD
jgi:hypothetical protein